MALHEFCGQLDPLNRKLFWDELLCWSVEYPNSFALAEKVVHRLGDRRTLDEADRTFLAGRFSDAETAFHLLFPKLGEQLELRSRPLRELWEGFGRGLMAHVGRLTDKKLWVTEAEVVLVQPVLGGFGLAHLGPNRVCIEALLTNPASELPEVVRLAWLLSQLQLDEPDYSGNVEERRLVEIGGLAMLPPILAAGQVVELTKIDEPNLALAIEQWQIPVPPKVDVVRPLLAWWETYLQTRPEWSVAMSALDRMLMARS